VTNEAGRKEKAKVLAGCRVVIDNDTSRCAPKCFISYTITSHHAPLHHPPTLPPPTPHHTPILLPTALPPPTNTQPQRPNQDTLTMAALPRSHHLLQRPSQPPQLRRCRPLPVPTQSLHAETSPRLRCRHSAMSGRASLHGQRAQ